jgi:hypothetical protein
MDRRIEDYDGQMARAELLKIGKYANKLFDMIHEEDELEAWVQSKLAVVAAYMGDIKHYLDYEINKAGQSMERDELDEELETYKKGGKTEAMWKVKPSTIADDMDEARQVVGDQEWKSLSYKEKIKRTKELKDKGIVGFGGEQEDIETLSAMQYYAKGGNIRHVKGEDKYKSSWGRLSGAVGEFDIEIQENGRKRWWYGTLYPLSDFDREYWANVKLKSDERLFRYESPSTRITGMKPVVKINIERGIIYFLKDINSNDDKNLDFETKGTKLKLLQLETK